MQATEKCTDLESLSDNNKIIVLRSVIRSLLQMHLTRSRYKNVTYLDQDHDLVTFSKDYLALLGSNFCRIIRESMIFIQKSS